MAARKASSGRTPKDRKKGGDELVFLPLGGAGEIGMNLYLYGFGPAHARKWLMVDLGVSFADLSDPGIDVLLPDTSFIEDRAGDLAGIVLTHAHEDHFGAVSHLWPRLKAPVYATPFAAELLKRRLQETGLDREVPVNIVRPGGRFKAGPFDIEYIDMTHSIPEANALAIRTPAGNVVHSGDWKIDPSPVIGDPVDEKALKRLGDEGCVALVCDSTNALRDGISPSESDVEKELRKVIAEAKGRVVVTSFASNVGRLLSVARAAYAARRDLVIAGRSMYRIVDVGRETGYLDELRDIVDEDDFDLIPPDQVVCLCTGSQGEARAALARIASDSHPNIALDEGDLVVFSSRTIPGNEKAVARIQNQLAALGAEIVTDSDRPIHVTGHPRRDELKMLYKLVRPQLVLPMHGEMRHLIAHARFARECGVPASIVAGNGSMVRLSPGRPAIIDEVEAGRLHLDGSLVMGENAGAVRERRRLAYAGAVAVALVLNRRNELACRPQISLFGVPEEAARGELFEDIVEDTVLDVIEAEPRARRSGDDKLVEAVRRAVVREIELCWGKRTLCEVKIERIAQGE